jgi:hypothetical protein
VRVSKDAYVGIWAIDADGTVVQIFPNKRETNNFLPADQPRLIPDKNLCTFETTRSKGLDHIWVIASTKPWDPIEGKNAGPYALFQSQEDQEKWTRYVRGIVVKPVGEESDTAQLVSEEVIPYRAVPK